MFRTVFFISALFLSFSASAQNLMTLEWKVGFHQKKNQQPSEWYKATVPGAVQLDYAQAQNWPNYTFDDNFKNYKWMEDVFWSYQTNFAKPDIQANELYFFVSKGIDYQFEIFLNGKKLFEQEGMFKAVELDLTEHLENDNQLQVLIYPVPKIPGKPDDRSQAAQSAKPAVSYGWDWHPRLIPTGIWDDTYLEKRNATHLSDVFVQYDLNEDFSEAQIKLLVEGANLALAAYEWQLMDPTGSKVLGKSSKFTDLSNASFTLSKPTLWWTHDYGEPNLYQSIFILKDANGKVLDKKEQKIGFRKVALVMHEGAWAKPDTFPKTRSNPPITVELNGRRIFGKGTNWVNPEIFPGTIAKARYQELLERAKEINFNLLRVWGGGIVNKEAFYDLCDEMGILVWTEFPLACNNYEGTEDYLSVLEQESEAIIKRIRKHPSNAIWSGGNELFNAWSGMTDQSLALRMLNSQCYRLDPQTPFIPTSPLMGMSHGHYVFKDMNTGEEVFEWMQRSEATAYTEFGMPGTASVELLKKIIPEEDLFPPMPGSSWETHHAFNAWVGDTWLMKDMLAEYFGEAPDLETLVAQSQWLQSEGYKCIFEEARRQKPVCSMALNWCFNEPWITAANNSLINYPNEPKPAFYAVKDACRPFIASARINKFSWKEGETFSCDVFLLNDLYENIPSGKLLVSLKVDGKEIRLLELPFKNLAANTNLQGPTARAILPYWNTDRFELVVEVEGQPQYSSSYLLKYSPSQERKVESKGARQLNH